MKIAYMMASGKGDTDLLLYEVAQQLEQQGLTCCGTTQINTERSTGSCDMDIKVLPTGPILRISQDLGSASKGCRLDPSALETAVALVDQSLNDRADILIINKFGKHEAGGRGFRDVIAKAIEMGKIVLVGLNPLNKQAFESFVGSDAVLLEPSVAAILNWVSIETTQILSAE